MSEIRRESAGFVGYEYKEIAASGERAAFCLDCYQSFGWVEDERAVPKGKLVLKRERRIVNKTELTRLQRHFEACMDEIQALERSKTTGATMTAILIGLIGTAFMAGSVFLVTGERPLWAPSFLLAVPGFACWASAYFAYRSIAARRSKIVAELMERKYDEIDDICLQGNRLL